MNEEHLFIEKLSQKMGAIRFAEETLDSRDREKSVGHDPTMRIPLLLDFRRSIFIRASLRDHKSLHDSCNMRFNHDSRISLKRSTVMNLALVLMVIWWTEIHQINARRFAQSDLTHHAMSRRLQMKLFVPRGANEGESSGIKGRGSFSLCVTQMGQVGP